MVYLESVFHLLGRIQIFVLRIGRLDPYDYGKFFFILLHKFILSNGRINLNSIIWLSSSSPSPSPSPFPSPLLSLSPLTPSPTPPQLAQVELGPPPTSRLTYTTYYLCCCSRRCAADWSSSRLRLRMLRLHCTDRDP